MRTICVVIEQRPNSRHSISRNWMSHGTGCSWIIHTQMSHWYHARSLTHIPKSLSEDSRKTVLPKQPPVEAVWDELWRVPHTMRTTAMALCLSVMEYRCTVWTRSSHRKLVNTTLNETCRPFKRYSRPIRTLRHHPTRNTTQR